MDIYLPIANLSVNALVIILLGGGVGVLSGMFGVGGGFLTTPLLIFYGIPPAVAAASASTQVTGASVSGVFAHMKRGGVDFQMGAVLVFGGIFGTAAGAAIFEILEALGQIDTVINILYVIMLGSIGGMMAKESLTSVRATRAGKPVPAAKRRHHPLVANLPMRWRFYRSGLYISPLAPLILGFITGIMTMLLGVGGGFIMVPAMIYLLGMPTKGTAEPAAATTIVLAGEDDWPPYSFADKRSLGAGHEPTGFSPRLIRAAFASQGVNVRFISVPFSRCMRLALTDQVAGCFNASITNENRNDYIWHSPPMFKEELSIFGAPSNDATPLTLADLPEGGWRRLDRQEWSQLVTPP